MTPVNCNTVRCAEPDQLPEVQGSGVEGEPRAAVALKPLAAAFLGAGY